LRFQLEVVDPTAEIEALLALGGFDNARVLEIGCGDGRLTFCYEQAAHSVLAIDPSAKAIAKARDGLRVESAARVRFEVGSALELDQPPASFDVALLSHSL
jgi:ubiquinone/menaquinone biosynthesis C-methylase UbiE